MVSSYRVKNAAPALGDPIRAVDLRMALGAIGIEPLAERLVGRRSQQQARALRGRAVRRELRPRRVESIVPRVAAQAEERGRLPQQVVGHGSVRLMANAAVLANRRVFKGKRALLLRVALVAQQVDGRLLEVLPVSY